MATKIGINGFGRIGRLVFRALVDQGLLGNEFEVVAINDLVPSDNLAYLLKYDSTQGRFNGTVEAPTDDSLVVNGHTIKCLAVREGPAALPWGDLGVDVVIESTGLFVEKSKAEGHIEAGAKKVIISAPAKGDVRTVVLGVNDEDLTADDHVVSNASCTTNCLAPVVRVLHDAIGIETGLITTIHAPTNTQSVHDCAHKDPRRARASQMNLIPTSTNSATAVTLIIPELKGKLDSIAVRTPVHNASLTDCVFQMQRDTTVEEVNSAIEKASQSAPLQGILGYETRPLVSSDYARDPRSGIVDALSTRVTGKRLVKVMVWYDNEWGYVNRMMELTKLVAENL